MWGGLTLPEAPFLPLLNRDEAQDIVSQHFGPQVAMLTELTNYASNLIPRAYRSSDKQLRDLIVCYSLLKQFASMLDAVDVLVRAGSIQAAMTPARVAFEATLYIEWMLVADGEQKAVHYFVGNVRAEREWARMVSRGTPQTDEFLANMGQLGADILGRTPALDIEASQHIARIDKILGRPEYAPVDQAFDAFRKRRRRPYDPSWYEVLGKTSVKQIAKELQRLPDYIVYYGEGSRVVHSASYTEHIKSATCSVATSKAPASWPTATRARPESPASARSLPALASPTRRPASPRLTAIRNPCSCYPERVPRSRRGKAGERSTNSTTRPR
jgi:Family of unknown function (DUF5677)